MDKEMQAKIDEIFKSKSRRKLSMDEADKVVGGSEKFPHPITIMGCRIEDEQSLSDFISCFAELEKAFGGDVAIGLLLDQLKSYTVKLDYSQAGLAGLENVLYHICTNSPGKKEYY